MGDIQWYEDSEIKRLKSKIRKEYFDIFNSLVKLKSDSDISFFKMNSPDKQTKYLKNLLAVLAGENGYRVYTNGIDKENYDKFVSKLSLKNVPDFHLLNPTEWLFDIHWYLDKGDEKGKLMKFENKQVLDHYCPISFPLAVESEWKNGTDKKQVKYAHIKYDFQKLLFCNAEMRLVIFKTKTKNQSDLHNDELIQYFENAIKSYPTIPAKSKFMFIAINRRIKKIYFGLHSKTK